jgi:hypothetical protein
MATVTNAQTFVSGETVTPAKLNALGLPTVTLAAGEVDATALASNAVTTSKIDASAVTDAKLATGAVTGAAGGGKLAPSAITGQTVIADPLASGDEFLVHDVSAAALRRVGFGVMQPAGGAINTLQGTNSSYTSITSVISRSDTAPTSTSGTEILSQAITPLSSSNKILVRFSAWGSHSTAMESTAVICRGSTVIQVCSSGTRTDESATFSCEFLDSPNTSSSVTYSVRIGVSTGTYRLNGTTARLFGGTSSATLTLQEIKG